MSFVLNGGAGIGQLHAPLQIKIGEQQVVAAGTVLVSGKQLQFELANLTYVLSFESDGGAPRLGTPTPSGTTLRLPLYNFNNPIGSGTTVPLEVGTLVGRKLRLAFMVYALSESGLRTVHYTFTVGEAA